jgi:Zn finger protein HypA/HybF involved in hydrogenase expression
LDKPIWLDAPEDAGEKLAELMRQASESVIEPPKPPDPFNHLSPHERRVLEALLEVNILTVSEIASLLQSDKTHAYEVMIALAEKGLASFKTEGEEKAIVCKVASLEEVQEGRWQCAGCHAFLSVDEIAFGICPRCGSNAFWAP